MLSIEDKELLHQKGITEQQISDQLDCFKKGFPYLKLKSAASVNNGVLCPTTEESAQYIKMWDAYIES